MFTIKGRHFDVENPSSYLNVNNRNAADLLRWLDLPFTEEDIYGEISATELAAKCRRRLWPEPRNDDPGLDGSDTKRPGKCRIVECGRDPGYLKGRTEVLLKLCEKAGPGGVICWA
jgi:hypothetical protein